MPAENTQCRMSVLNPCPQTRRQRRKSPANRQPFHGRQQLQFVDIHQPGGLYKANFALKEAPPAKETSKTETPAQKAAVEPARPNPLGRNAREYDAELAILSPSDDGIAAGDQINVMLKAAQGAPLTLKVNGDVVPASQLGRSMVHPAKRIALYEYINVPLKSGSRNLLEVEMRDTSAMYAGGKRSMSAARARRT